MAKPEKSSPLVSRDTHAGNAKQLKTHKSSNIASTIVGIIGVFFAFVSIMSIGTSNVSGTAGIGIFLGLVSAGLALPQFLDKIKADNKKDIRNYLIMAIGAIAVIGSLVGIIGDPIAKNVSCSKINDIAALRIKGCDKRAQELEDKQKQAEEEAIKAKEQEYKNITEQVVGKTYNANDANFCTQHASSSQYYIKSFYFDDKTHVTATYCDGHAETTSLKKADKERTLYASSLGDNYIEVSEDYSYIYNGKAKYNTTAKTQDKVEKKEDDNKTSSSSNSSTTATSTASSSNSQWRQVLSDYEAFMNKYVDFMKKYKNSSNTSSMLADYSKLMKEYADWTKKIGDMKSDLSGDDLSYYLEAMGRVSKKLSEV